MKTCPHCHRVIDVITPAELLRVAANMAPAVPEQVTELVIEAAFTLTCLIDVEIARLAATPAQRDQMLALLIEHVEDRIAGK